MKVPDLRNEWWLAKRIYGRELCTLFCGVTDAQITMARMLAAILERGLQETMVGKSQTTFAQAFERLYGISLKQRQGKQS
jgi:hypothetical protein